LTINRGEILTKAVPEIVACTFPRVAAQRFGKMLGMGSRDKQVDAYIAQSADFAQPILRELRDIVHAGCPEVEETMKWGCPHFVYRGMFCSMAAFKRHCSFGFWKSSLILDHESKKDGAMGQFGRITSRRDLPARKVLLGYVKKARELNEKGVKKKAMVRGGRTGNFLFPPIYSQRSARTRRPKLRFRPSPIAGKRIISTGSPKRRAAKPGSGD
jgi:hypothetical protein